MLKIKYILMLIIISTGLVAATLETSDQLGNLEVVLDLGCEKNHQNDRDQVPTSETQRFAKTKAVETVNYTLKGCDGMISFPVTVRANKKQGE